MSKETYEWVHVYNWEELPVLKINQTIVNGLRHPRTLGAVYLIRTAIPFSSRFLKNKRS
jgi:hypothetical protein